jgi:hypothetical protein
MAVSSRIRAVCRVHVSQRGWFGMVFLPGDASGACVCQPIGRVDAGDALLLQPACQVQGAGRLPVRGSPGRCVQEGRTALRPLA